MDSPSSFPRAALIGGGVFLLFAMLGTGALAALYVQADATRRPHIVSTSSHSLSSLGASALGTSTLDEGDESDEDVYIPQSAYIEEGADSDEVTLGFEQGEQPAPTGEPIDDAEVQDVVYAHQDALIDCYAEGLERDEDLEGRVDFHFRIAPDGHVAMVEITESELEDRLTEDCFVDAAKSWGFPHTNRAQLLRFDTNFTFAF